MQEKQPGRPLGPIAESVLELLHERHPLSAREISEALQLTLNIADLTCRRLESRGQIRTVERVRLAGVSKPVKRFAVVRHVQHASDFQYCYFRNT